MALTLKNKAKLKWLAALSFASGAALFGFDFPLTLTTVFVIGVLGFIASFLVGRRIDRLNEPS